MRSIEGSEDSEERGQLETPARWNGEGYYELKTEDMPMPVRCSNATLLQQTEDILYARSSTRRAFRHGS